MIDLKKFKALAAIEGKHCISFFIPTHRAGQSQEDRIRYKNAISEVKSRLEDRAIQPPEISRRLSTAMSKINDTDFWLSQSDGLAVFINNDTTEFVSLPIDVVPFVYIGQQLYLKPLIPVFTENHPFFLLAISQNNVRFFEGTRYSLTEIETEGYFPKSLEDTLKYEVPQKSLQYHGSQPGAASPIYHGQGAGKDTMNVKITNYLRSINQGVMDLMCPTDDAPLILAADISLISRYREINEYKRLQKDYIPGNPEQVDPILLHEKAWMIVEPAVQAKHKRDRQEFESALSSESASFSLHEIVPAALSGQVDTLFVEKTYEIWGVYDDATHQVKIHQERQDDSMPLIERAAVHTVLNGGKVYVRPRMDLPRPVANLNAIYRYVMA